MKINEPVLLKLLADGQFHSGQELASRTGVSRTAVWKHLDSLRAKGLVVDSARGRGYRLETPLELLDAGRIRRSLQASTRKSLRSLDVHYQLDSTSNYLRARMQESRIHAHVVLAEYQSEGRGRGNNEWLAAPAAGLCLSIGWHFDSTPKTLPALSLATGVVLAACLAGSGAQSIRLKWPNDLVHGEAKLGGILIESRGQHAGEVDVIIGIGINIDMPVTLARRVGQPVTDLTRIIGYRPSRNQLAAAIIDRVFEMLENYPAQGFESYVDRWRELDITRNRPAVLHRNTGPVSGRVVDIDENGFLLMEVDGSIGRYSSGDLSLRLRR